MKTIVIVGAAGQLGQYLVEVFQGSRLDVNIVSLARQEMDLSDSSVIDDTLLLSYQVYSYHMVQPHALPLESPVVKIEPRAQQMAHLGKPLV